MTYNFEEINIRALHDPVVFVKECEDRFNNKVNMAARQISAGLSKSRVVLLSGPSGSGKTTTAHKVTEKLEEMGIKAHPVALDKYLITYGERAPRTADGEIDFESPHGIDLPLLIEHFDILEEGGEITIPHFSFKMQDRDKSKESKLKLGKNEVVIFEGIHALNDILTDAHPQAFKLYIAAESNIERDGEIFFKRSWVRLSRRVVRDSNFRGLDASFTLKSWANVRIGEKQYISPFKTKADILFDSSLEYEVPMMKSYATKALKHIPRDIDRGDELCSMLPVFEQFEHIDCSLVPEDSIMREFIGGGKYKY